MALRMWRSMATGTYTWSTRETIESVRSDRTALSRRWLGVASSPQYLEDSQVTEDRLPKRTSTGRGESCSIPRAVSTLPTRLTIASEKSHRPEPLPPLPAEEPVAGCLWTTEGLRRKRHYNSLPPWL